MGGQLMDQALATIALVFRLAAVALAGLALAKLAGISIPMRASVLELAGVAIALSLAKG